MSAGPRQPTFYLTHGAGPCFWMTLPPPFEPGAFDGLKSYFAGLLAQLPSRPRAIVVASAHWEEPQVTVSTARAPSMLYDYHGFPPETYQLRYPAPGNPVLGERIRELLDAAGIAARTDERRGFDHGVFVPMLIIDPHASIPTVMVSVVRSLDALEHYAIGAALAPLRDEGVLILGSGSSFHNMRAMLAGSPSADAADFDHWLHQTVTVSEPEERRARLSNWRRAPGAQFAHPRAEHLIPLMVAAGAAGSDPGARPFSASIGGQPYSCFRFG